MNLASVASEFEYNRENASLDDSIDIPINSVHLYTSKNDKSKQNLPVDPAVYRSENLQA